MGFTRQRNDCRYPINLSRACISQELGRSFACSLLAEPNELASLNPPELPRARIVAASQVVRSGDLIRKEKVMGRDPATTFPR